MDQKKIGSFLKELRKEKGLTQSQAAEHFNVSDRTISRWETGANMPDLSLLIEIADFYNVEIKDLIDGERKENIMNKEEKETLTKVAEYVDHFGTKKAMTRDMIITVCSYMAVCLIVLILLSTEMIYSFTGASIGIILITLALACTLMITNLLCYFRK